MVSNRFICSPTTHHISLARIFAVTHLENSKDNIYIGVINRFDSLARLACYIWYVLVAVAVTVTTAVVSSNEIWILIQANDAYVKPITCFIVR